MRKIEIANPLLVFCLGFGTASLYVGSYRESCSD